MLHKSRLRAVMALLAVFALVLGACGDDTEMMTFTDTDSGSEIEVDQGEPAALAGEASRHGRTEAAAGSGDQGNLLHVCTSTGNVRRR